MIHGGVSDDIIFHPTFKNEHNNHPPSGVDISNKNQP